MLASDAGSVDKGLQEMLRQSLETRHLAFYVYEQPEKKILQSSVRHADPRSCHLRAITAMQFSDTHAQTHARESVGAKVPFHNKAADRRESIEVLHFVFLSIDLQHGVEGNLTRRILKMQHGVHPKGKHAVTNLLIE